MPAKKVAGPIRAGVATVDVVGRYYHPQPGAVVLGAGARAEAELAEGRDPDGGNQTELVIVAVEPGNREEVEARIRRALAAKP